MRVGRLAVQATSVQVASLEFEDQPFCHTSTRRALFVPARFQPDKDLIGEFGAVVLQDAMLRLHRSLARVQPESVSQFFGLAAIQIRRTLIDLVRRHFGPEGPGGYRHVSVHEVDPAAASGGPATLDAWAEFYEALDNLAGQEREVIDLLWFEGLTQSEAAEVPGVNERTVRRRWHSARYSLYKALTEGKPQ